MPTTISAVRVRRSRRGQHDGRGFDLRMVAYSIQGRPPRPCHRRRSLPRALEVVDRRGVDHTWSIDDGVALHERATAVQEASLPR
jgi:hypothetical protein